MSLQRWRLPHTKARADLSKLSTAAPAAACVTLAGCYIPDCAYGWGTAGLQPSQLKLLQALHNTGKPVVLVVSFPMMGANNGAHGAAISIPPALTTLLA